MLKIYLVFFFLLACLIYGVSTTVNLVIFLIAGFIIFFGIQGLLKAKRMNDHLPEIAGWFFIILGIVILIARFNPF